LDATDDLVASDNHIRRLSAGGRGVQILKSGSPFATFGNPNAVVIGDFNGDGARDLAIVGDSGFETAAAGGNDTANNVAVFLGNGLGGFTVAPGSPFAVGVGRNSIARIILVE